MLQYVSMSGSVSSEILTWLNDKTRREKHWLICCYSLSDFFFSTGMKMAVDLTPAKIAHTFHIFYNDSCFQ